MQKIVFCVSAIAALATPMGLGFPLPPPPTPHHGPWHLAQRELTIREARGEFSVLSGTTKLSYKFTVQFHPDGKNSFEAGGQIILRTVLSDNAGTLAEGDPEMRLTFQGAGKMQSIPFRLPLNRMALDERETNPGESLKSTLFTHFDDFGRETSLEVVFTWYADHRINAVLVKRYGDLGARTQPPLLTADFVNEAVVFGRSVSLENPIKNDAKTDRRVKPATAPPSPLQSAYSELFLGLDSSGDESTKFRNIIRRSLGLSTEEQQNIVSAVGHGGAAWEILKRLEEAVNMAVECKDTISQL